MSLASPSLTFRLGCDWPPVGAESSPRSPWPGGKRAWLRLAARRQRHPSRAPGPGPRPPHPLPPLRSRSRLEFASAETGLQSQSWLGRQGEGGRRTTLSASPRAARSPCPASPGPARPPPGPRLAVCAHSPRARCPAASLMTSAFVFTLSSSLLHQTCRQACPFIGWRGSSPVFLVGREVSTAAG